MGPQGRAGSPDGECHRGQKRRRSRKGADVLGVPAGAGPRDPSGSRHLVAIRSGGPLHPRQAGGEGHRSDSRRRPPHLAAAGVARSDRAPSRRTGNPGFRCRRVARCLREGGGSSARLQSLRRAVGPALARSDGLCRHDGHVEQRLCRARLAISRLSDPGLQHGQAVRRVRPRADRGRPDARRLARGEGGQDGGHRVLDGG